MLQSPASLQRRYQMLPVLLLAISLPGLAPLSEAQPGRQDETRHEQYRSRQQQKPSRLSPGEAASRAQARHGGKVLKVSASGNGYKVRLLLDSGRVITVTIKD
ncbi:MAG: PepSY domain-containing protein [Parahaliea sp.]